jgi:hypothetical protein
MTIIRVLAVAAVAGAIAAPAATQPYPYPNPNPYPNPGYPGYPDPGYPGYPDPGYGAQGTFGQFIDQLLGNRYNVNDRRAVHRCADAAAAEAWDQYGQNNYRWRGWDYRRYASNNMRVTAITDVQRRSGSLRVSGLIDSGLLYGQENRPNRNRQAYLRFRCNIDYGGVVTNVRVWPNNLYRR